MGRGEAAPNWLLMYQDSVGKSAERRLGIMRDTEDGFRIAEEDLKMRGAGDVIGTAQSGLPGNTNYGQIHIESMGPGLMSVAK